MKLSFQAIEIKIKLRKSPKGYHQSLLFTISHKRCEVCDNVTETLTFTSTATQNIYKINNQFKCSEKCLINLFKCNECFRQYVGQTVDEFRCRWNNYKANDRKLQRLEPCLQEHLFSPFSLAGHDRFLNNVSITFIDKTDPLILYGKKITGDKHLKQWFFTGLILKIVSDGCFCVYFFTW